MLRRKQREAYEKRFKTAADPLKSRDIAVWRDAEQAAQVFELQRLLHRLYKPNARMFVKDVISKNRHSS